MKEALALFLNTLPKPLHEAFLLNWEKYHAQSQSCDILFPQEESFYLSLWKVISLSDYAAQIFCAYPKWPVDFFHLPNQSYAKEAYQKRWQPILQKVENEVALMHYLRLFRHQEITRIIWRLLLKLCTFTEHLQELTHLADVCIQIVTDYYYEQLCIQWGIPCNDKGEKQPFIVLALGKLGGEELNLSSDVDLIFAYPEDGFTQGEQGRWSNQQFFTRLGQQIIHGLAQVTEDGFVYRVDMRLRPHGQSGALVYNFASLENYYQYHGREWERYALIKARVVTNTQGYGQRLLALLHPFVYRRYLDYGAFEALREMKALVSNEVKRRRLENDLKLGPGGIRQIEFLTQALQLIRGGQNQQFQHHQLLVALSRLSMAGYIDPKAGEELKQAYIFLRLSEHIIQMMHDSQTHALPDNLIDQSQLYFAMGFSTWEAFLIELKRHKQIVQKQFELISQVPNMLQKVNGNTSDFMTVWSQLEDEEAIKILSKMGFEDTEAILTQLLQFKNSKLYQSLKKHAVVRLDKVMPVLIVMLAKKQQPLPLLNRMLRLMRSIARRSAYLALLMERPQALAFLVDICEASEWVLEQLCAYPVLLDELLSPPSLEEVVDKNHLMKELDQRLEWLAIDDLEAQMDHLRQFKLACFLNFATRETLSGTSIEITRALSDVTEVILNKIYHISLDYMVKHYRLQETVEQIKLKIPFSIIAYGKLGARELNYSSDLDLVFLYDTLDDKMVLTGQSQFTPAEFSIRLAQRIIHMLSTHTSSGTLYEVDVRLRPGGSAGLLVSHFSAFKKYLHENAWTFEHQALVKARVVVGGSYLQNAFENLRTQILTVKRDSVFLRKEISNMREKMQEQHRHLSKKTDLKTISGGLADIDFIVQYAVLHFAGTHLRLLAERDSISILQWLSVYRLMNENDLIVLMQAYSEYQMLIRRKILQPEFDLTSYTGLSQHLENVQRIWRALFSET